MQKLLINIIRGSIFSGIWLMCLLIGGFVFYMENSIDLIMFEENQKRLYKQIEETPELPEKFYSTLEKYKPGYFETSYWESLISKFLNGKRKTCQCKEIYYPILNGRFNLMFKSHILALELEERFSQRKCFAFDLNSTYFGRNIIGVKNAAKFYFQKELTELNEEEILKLDLMKNKPVFYDPIKNKKRVNRAIYLLMKQK